MAVMKGGAVAGWRQAESFPHMVSGASAFLAQVLVLSPVFHPRRPHFTTTPGTQASDQRVLPVWSGP